jgi:hypothetical protein
MDVAFEVGRIIFTDGGLRSNLQNGAEKTLRAAEITAQRSAPDVENYMKNNAPWTDQTGNARNGLQARAYRSGDEIGIDCFGSVPYQVYLETRFSGHYAIIQPTIDAMGPVVMRRFERLLERI